MIDNKKSPEIRFDSFIEPWEIKHFHEVLIVNSGRDYKHLDKGTISVYGTGGYMLSVNDKLSDVDGVGIGRKGTIDKPQYLKAPYWTVDTLFFLTTNKAYDLMFLYSMAQCIDWKIYNEATGVPSLSKVVIEKITQRFPVYDEQIIIGNFFSSLDDAIVSKKQEYEKTINIKKSMLEKMFPTKGADVPEIRFDGFTEPWEIRKLGEHTKLITKGTTPKDKSGHGDIHFVKVENIINGQIIPVSCISVDEHENYLSRSKLEENDILFSIAGTLGRTALVCKSILPANTNQALAIIRGYDFDIQFLLVSLNSSMVVEYLQRNPVVGAQPNLSLAQIGDLTIRTPSKAEQIAIGNFFLTLDTLIDTKRQALKKLQNIKNACLNKMFVIGA
ncbi:MAG: restriction endonuclease subunit S [Defluviitaleaceae bacterium]|nr:restriction endonuclease subunit S [Defluviitaleaceae bacterium]